MKRYLVVACSLVLVGGAGLTAAPTDTLIVLNKEGHTAWLIDPATGEARAKLDVGEGPHEAAVSPDGRTAVVTNYGSGGSGGRTLSVIDVPTARVTRTIDLSPHRRPHGIQFLPGGGHVLVTAESSSKLLEIEVSTGRIAGTFDTGGDSHMVEVAPGGGKAYATSIFGGILSVVDLTGSGSSPRTAETGSGTEALAIRPGSEEVWVGNNNEHNVKIVDTRNMKVAGEVEVGLQPIRLAFTKDGKHLLASCIISGDLAVIDPALRKVVRRVPLSDVFLRESDWQGKPDEEVRPLAMKVVREGARPIGIQLGPDGKLAYVANRGLNEIAVVDLTTWKVIRRLPAGKGPDGMAWSRIGT